MIERNSRIIILIGNIGSGKTTIVNKFVKLGYITVARDKLRYMMGNGDYIFNELLEQTVWNTELNMIENLMQTKTNIIVDEVGINKKIRKRYINLANKYKYTIVSVIMPRLNKKESVDRRMNNPHGQPNRELWEEVWENFDNLYEEPTLEEGFDSIYTADKHDNIRKKY